MDNLATFRTLLVRSLFALLVCAVLVVVCYYFVDQAVAYYVHDQEFDQLLFLKWLTYPPPILQSWTPAVLAGLMVRRAWRPLGRWERALIAGCVGVLVADQCKESLAFVFGRYWPGTWVNNNPSLLKDGAYGFHPFTEGSAYGSFPSGHSARTLAAAAVLWIAYPRWRWLSVGASVAGVASLVGMDYHFVGDVIAGGFIGALTGVYAAACCGVGALSEAQPQSGKITQGA